MCCDLRGVYTMHGLDKEALYTRTGVHKRTSYVFPSWLFRVFAACNVALDQSSFSVPNDFKKVVTNQYTRRPDGQHQSDDSIYENWRRQMRYHDMYMARSALKSRCWVLQTENGKSFKDTLIDGGYLALRLRGCIDEAAAMVSAPEWGAVQSAYMMGVETTSGRFSSWLGHVLFDTCIDLSQTFVDVNGAFRRALTLYAPLKMVEAGVGSAVWKEEARKHGLEVVYEPTVGYRLSTIDGRTFDAVLRSTGCYVDEGTEAAAAAAADVDSDSDSAEIFVQLGVGHNPSPPPGDGGAATVVCIRANTADALPDILPLPKWSRAQGRQECPSFCADVPLPGPGPDPGPDPTAGAGDGDSEPPPKKRRRRQVKRWGFKYLWEGCCHSGYTRLYNSGSRCHTVYTHSFSLRISHSRVL